MDYQPLLEKIRKEIEIYAHEGKQADYIPALANVNPDQFGLCLRMLDGRTYRLGESDVKFSIQSIAKVFSLAIALSILGKELWTRIGKEPSGSAFNSLVQLEYEHGKPRNPFINAGALVTADVILTHIDNPKEFFIEFVRSRRQSQHQLLRGSDAFGDELLLSECFHSLSAEASRQLAEQRSRRSAILLYDVFGRDELRRPFARILGFCQEQRTVLARRCQSHRIKSETHQCHYADLRLLR